eukprot:2200478-Rhodomonas_salina.3
MAESTTSRASEISGCPTSSATGARAGSGRAGARRVLASSCRVACIVVRRCLGDLFQRISTLMMQSQVVSDLAAADAAESCR